MLKVLCSILLVAVGALAGNYWGEDFPAIVVWCIALGIAIFLVGYWFGEKAPMPQKAKKAKKEEKSE